MSAACPGHLTLPKIIYSFLKNSFHSVNKYDTVSLNWFSVAMPLGVKDAEFGRVEVHKTHTA